jgi:hypothetical protein
MLDVADVGRPCVTPPLPYRDGRRGKGGVVECSHGNAEACRSALAGPANRGAAVRTEMMIDPGPCVAGAGVDFVRPIEANMFFCKVGGAGPGRTRSPLAVVAMTDIDHDRLARDDDAELTAKALRGSFHHSPPEIVAPPRTPGSSRRLMPAPRAQQAVP